MVVQSKKTPQLNALYFAYIVFVNRFLHLCHYKTTFCQNNLSKSEDYFWNTYSMLQKHYALWVMAKIVAFLKNFQILFEQNVTSNVTRNQKLKHIYIHLSTLAHAPTNILSHLCIMYTHTCRPRETKRNNVKLCKQNKTAPNCPKLGMPNHAKSKKHTHTHNNKYTP